ncbi:tetratricopeptide repeat protein [Chenggangzhangella methanolivorans]|uniref:tetratricopeptide repeat protein n=1 Tax=Chenggangzhangella methanolivorans TaxID=1437009 RepID=UPI00361BBF30
MTWFQKLLGSSLLVPRDREAERRTEEEQDVAALMEMAYEAAERGDYDIAVGVWGPLAAQGWPPRALSNLGACYVEGLGVSRDLAKAAKLFARGAEAGDSVAQRNLATLHFKGEGGVEQDDAAALELFEAAAEQGDAAAQDMLSWMLLEGQGDEPDPQGARRWALAAAEQGVASSMTRLGLIAHNALGMERDPEEAARWWYEAARRGDADGQAMLGASLHLGSGVEKDDRAALIWLIRAGQGGSPLAASFVAAVRAALGPEDISAAEAVAAQPPIQEGAA